MDTTPVVPHTEAVVAETPRNPLIAPVWHTLLLVAILIAFSWANANVQHEAARAGRWVQYVSTMAWEWILFGYVWFGVRRRGVRLRELVGGRWACFEDVLIDVALAAAFWIVALIALSALGYAMHMTGANKLDEVRQQLGFLIPRTRLEIALWIGLSATAGICEEVIFRGYLQRQFAAFTRSVWVGLILSGILFGAGHGYEGGKRMMLIAIYGMMFGTLALARKSLRPGIMAHAAHDAITGLVLRVLVK